MELNLAQAKATRDDVQWYATHWLLMLYIAREHGSKP
jgi:hypothetical protein